MPIFLVRCSGGRERNVAELISKKAKSLNLPVYAVLNTGEVKGYILIEASSRATVAKVLYGMNYIKSGPVALVNINDLASKLKREVEVEKIEVGDIVELSEPRGMRGKVKWIDNKGNVEVELLETPGLTHRVNISSLKLIDKHQESTMV